MQNNNWLTALKGLIIGATMIVPGVSGGTMAMILGIYDQLINAISYFRKDIKRNIIFLALFVIGAGVGAFFFSSPLSWLLENYRTITMYFFIGAVFGGIPVIERKSKVKKITRDVVVCILVGVAIVLLISAIPVSAFQSSIDSGGAYIGMLVIMGMISAIALILPGISISHFFLIMGLYDELLEAIKSFDLVFLLSVGIGGLIGIVLFARLLDYVMNRFPRPTYMIILGFILGSVAEIFPGIPMDFTVFVCVGVAVTGFLAVKKFQINKT